MIASRRRDGARELGDLEPPSGRAGEVALSKRARDLWRPTRRDTLLYTSS